MSISIDKETTANTAPARPSLADLYQELRDIEEMGGVPNMDKTFGQGVMQTILEDIDAREAELAASENPNPNDEVAMYQGHIDQGLGDAEAHILLQDAKQRAAAYNANIAADTQNK